MTNTEGPVIFKQLDSLRHEKAPRDDEIPTEMLQYLPINRYNK